MAFLVFRQSLYPDGTRAGCAYFFDPVNGRWICFGIDGFCAFVYDYQMEPVTSFRSFEGDDYFEYVLYSVPVEFYKSALEVLE